MAIRYFKNTDPRSDYVRFVAISDSDDDEGQGAIVSLVKGRETPNYVVERTGMRDKDGNPVYQHTYNQHVYRPDPSTSEGQLFHHTPPTIPYAEAAQGMRFAAPVLLGLAFNESKKTGKLMADHSLSAHSSRLAKRAAQMGAVQPHPDNRDFAQTNDMDFEEEVYVDDYARAGTQVSRAEMKEARTAIRELVHGRNKRHLSKDQFSNAPAHEQLRLDL